MPHRHHLDKQWPFDKYDLYIKAVQSPKTDVLFYHDCYKDIRGAQLKPQILREDFCGTGMICAEWVKMGSQKKAIGLDLDDEPMNYGYQKFEKFLRPEQRKRLSLQKKNVLRPGLPMADVAVAVNFSYYFFKDRQMLKKYFKNVHSSLKKNGIFIVDSFGGTNCTDEIKDRTKLKGFTYIWNQKNFDPYSNHAEFSIDFKVGSKTYPDVFTYDWRMWTIPEVREIMLEAGFKKAYVYWEGTAHDGGGNGHFKRVEKGEACLSWIAYIVGVK